MQPVLRHLPKAAGCLAFGGMAAAHGPLATAFERLEDAPDAVTALGAVFGAQSKR